MTHRTSFAAVIGAACLVLNACHQQRARFEPGDPVTRKLTGERGVVALRMRFFADNKYWLKMPGGERDGNGVLAAPGERTVRNRDWHFDGPYYDDDLVLAKN